MEMSCVASTGGPISSTAKPARFCRTPNPHPQPSPVTDWTLEIMPCPMLHTTRSHENPLTTTASFSFLLSWKVHQQWWIEWEKLVKGHLGCQRAFLFLLSSSRSWARMNCPSPSTWNSPGWFPKILEAVKEKCTKVSDVEKHVRARTFPFPFASCLPHHSQWFQHLSFLTTHGMRNTPCTQQTQKRAAPVQIQAVSCFRVRNGMSLW